MALPNVQILYYTCHAHAITITLLPCIYFCELLIILAVLNFILLRLFYWQAHTHGRDVVKMAVVSSLPFCGARPSVTTFPEEQQDLERTSLTVLYSNVRPLRQAYGELCKTCTTHQSAIVCLTETNLFQGATDAVCPAE